MSQRGVGEIVSLEALPKLTVQKINVGTPRCFAFQRFFRETGNVSTTAGLGRFEGSLRSCQDPWCGFTWPEKAFQNWRGRPVKARKISEVDGGHGKFNAGCCPPRLSVSLHFDATCIPAWSGADSEADSTVIFRGVIAETDSGMVQRWDSLLVSVA